MTEFLPYIIVAFGYIASPGPAVLLIISNSIRYGFKKSFLTIVGNSTGLALLALTFSLGVSELLNQFPILITIMRIVGATYLAYLGLKAIGLITSKKSKMKNISESSIQISPWGFFKQGFFLASMNPKPILFFAAIFPQFLLPEEPLPQQFFALSLIFIALSFCILCSYSLISSLAQEALTKGKKKKTIDLLLGSLLISMSMYMLYDTLLK